MTIFTNRRYILHEQLGEGGMGAVYRATDRLAGTVVALKRVILPSKDKKIDNRLQLALAQEFRILASLRHPNVIGVLDYGFDSDRQPYYTMSLMEEPRNILEYGWQEPIEVRVKLLIQVLQALAYLHRRGILHRDLKPSNILVTQDIVKVLDFGLAVEEQKAEGVMVGTIAYIAPEVLRQFPASEASDLYAVGVIAYELFVGNHPFDTSNTNKLVSDMLTSEPDLTPLEQLDDNALFEAFERLDEGVTLIGFDMDATLRMTPHDLLPPTDSPVLRHPLSLIIGRLLAKDPNARYHDAFQVIQDLSTAINQPPPEETIAIRESYLQAAKFVGRDAEIAHLSEILTKMMQGQPAAWLIGGESGVGKSRLLDELRTLALVEGAAVVRGQAVRDGGSPYQVWRDVLRWLVLQTTPDLDNAIVLKSVVSDIEGLVGQMIPDLRDFDPQSLQRRLWRSVIDLFQCQKQPLVVILEDLHWAGSESIAMLDYLTQNLIEKPILFIGNYRNDESPHLAVNLPAMQEFRLGRLSEPAVVELSESILGEIGRHPEVIRFLQRESEGNVFFLVEVVRALAEKAGELTQIGQTKLPDSVVTGGVQAIIERRLKRISEEARPLLQQAAIAGRELDLYLIQALNNQRGIDEWLTTCTNAAVLEVQLGKWRFAHDKLRERILDDLTGSARTALHRHVARTIEAIYPDKNEKAAALAQHWRMAGNTDKELRFSTLAGQQAVQNSANTEAVRYFSRAIAILQSLPETPETILRELQLQISLGAVLMGVKGYGANEVEEAYRRALILSQQIEDAAQVFPVLWGLFSVYFSKAELHKSLELAEQLLQLAQHSDELTLVANWGMAMVLYCLGEFRQCRDYLEKVLAVYTPQQHHTLAYQYGTDPGVICNGFMGWTLWLLGYPDQALHYNRRAIELAQQLGNAYNMAYAIIAAAQTRRFRREGKATQALAEQAIALALEQDFALFWAEGTMLQSWALAEHGKVNDEIIDQMNHGLQASRNTGAEIARPFFLSMLAELYGKAGLIQESLEAVAEGLNTVKRGKERRDEAELYRIKGELLLRQEASDVEIEACFHKAIDIARHQNAKSWELRAIMSLCRLWQAQGNHRGAYQVLKEVVDWFTEGFDTPDLQEARALLEDLVSV